MPCLFLKAAEGDILPPLCLGQCKQSGYSVFPDVQESICVSLPITTAMICLFSPGRLPVLSSDFLWTHSHVFSGVKCASSSLSLCFVLGFCLCLWLSLPYLLVPMERHWQFIYVLHEDSAHKQQASTALCLLRQR